MLVRTQDGAEVAATFTVECLSFRTAMHVIYRRPSLVLNIHMLYARRRIWSVNKPLC